MLNKDFILGKNNFATCIFYFVFVQICINETLMKDSIANLFKKTVQ